MARFSPSHLIKFLLFSTSTLLFTNIEAQTSFRPKALLLQVTKDPSTLQYLTRFTQRTPPKLIDIVVDLGGRYLWVDCDKGYVSSSYRPVFCRSAGCALAGNNGCGQCFSPPRPNCNNNTCVVGPDNTVTYTGTSGEVAFDVVALQSTNGSNPSKAVSVPRFIFGCGATSLLDGLAKGVAGMAGLGRTKISLPWQFYSSFSMPRKFAMCLSSSTNKDFPGIIIFGNSPYYLLPLRQDLSKSLIYTPLLDNPISTAPSYPLGEPSAEYFIGVKSIKIGEKTVPLTNTALLSINKTDGYGGTKISTVNPYTVMESSIYKAVIEAYSEATKGMKRARSVAPFGLCYDSKNIGSTRVGPAVPVVDLVLESESVYWRIWGANLMVEVGEDVLCLGIVDGGERSPRFKTSIVIGGHQLEDNLLEFDLARSRLGFSSSLLFRQTTCANFNFTSIDN
ncbi:hypothetical protein Scep_030455 [Stephania cephalantha]|uniref:Peptidase A1 domain-containing protein n=1 Tax=Stephania cephalantha TaxID=152367 RepID=A0AAP0HED1_9MAGN